MTAPRPPKQPRIPTARRLAWQILREHRAQAGYANELIERTLNPLPILDPERRLLTELVFGVLRHRRSLDAMIEPFRRGNRPIDPPIREALRLGAYQLAYLDHVPAHAAVYETVELIRAEFPRVVGFVNGLLRRVSELVTSTSMPTPSADSLPRQPGVYRVLSQSVFPPPDLDPAGYLATAFSWPDWLASRWLHRLGFDECLRLGHWFNHPPTIWLRVNRLRTTREALLAAFTAAGIPCSFGEHPDSIRLQDRRPIRSLPGYAEGHFCVQDLTAMQVADALDPKPGQRILDLCAAPGGKTSHLAERMGNQGSIVACDLAQNRLNTLQQLCRRLGIDMVQSHLLSQEDQGSLPSGPFDAILLDVPCSNTGVLGRRPEVRERLREREISHLVQLQMRLIHQVVDRLGPGGVLVYSTCSMEQEENQGVVRAVLQELPRLQLETEQTTLPGQPADGGYWARLRVH